MENREAIEILSRPLFMDGTPKEILDAHRMAISALEKQELERWRRYPEEKPNRQRIVLATMPAYTDRNGDEHYSGVICAYHIDNCHGGWWGRSDGVTYGALGMCDADPVAWRPLPEPYTEEEFGTDICVPNKTADPYKAEEES